MPRTKGTGKSPTEQFSVRLGEDTAKFYRTKADEHGVSISGSLRRTLMQGVIVRNVQDIEQRLCRLLDEIRADGQGGGEVEIPSELWLSVFIAEYMLAAIVETRDAQQLYGAQNKAKAKLRRVKGGQNDKEGGKGEHR